ncbi:MAG: hypothetical protein N3I35_15705 [Clostridia bacterium]|nr:hypothetical protein [Clostridia bacterium]
MKKNIIFIIKNFLVLIITILMFGAASKLINGTGNMPQFLIDAYESSMFLKTGTKTLAIISLCSIITVFLLLNFHMIKEGIHNNRLVKGLIYGGSFGIVWFFGFTEFIVINHSENALQHLRSSIRDLLCLSLFGLVAGALLCKSQNNRMKRNLSSLVSIPFIALFFAVFHGTQLYFTFRSVAERQTISGLLDIIWLLAFGMWIGFMYYLFCPGIRFKNKYLKSLFFSYSIFGTNWLLFNSFYNIFLDIPLWDLFIRCFTGCTGIFIGLVVYEYVLGTRRLIVSKNVKGEV